MGYLGLKPSSLESEGSVALQGWVLGEGGVLNLYRAGEPGEGKRVTPVRHVHSWGWGEQEGTTTASKVIRPGRPLLEPVRP